MLAFDLENGVKVTKIWSTFENVPKIYLWQFGPGNQAEGYRDNNLNITTMIFLTHISSPVTLKRKSRSPKSNQLLKLYK